VGGGAGSGFVWVWGGGGGGADYWVLCGHSFIKFLSFFLYIYIYTYTHTMMEKNTAKYSCDCILFPVFFLLVYHKGMPHLKIRNCC